MLRLVDIVEQTSTGIVFETEEIGYMDQVAYVVFDTSTGIGNMEDYYAWRSTTTSTGDEAIFKLNIDNTNNYPKIAPKITSYNSLNPSLFKIMTLTEYQIFEMTRTRIDLVRKRLPNPGVYVTGDSGVGENGVVSHAGGFEKKFSLEEYRQMMDGALIEVNIHPPTTEFWWSFDNISADKNPNPYQRTINGIPWRIADLIVQGTMIRCLIAWGLLEVDLNFTTSDNGLQVTFDRVNNVASWMQNLLAEYTKQKDLYKWDFVNSYGVGVGSIPFSAAGIWGTMMNMISGGSGVVPLNSMLGYGIRANTPL